MTDPMDDRVVRGLIVCPPGDVNYRYSLLPRATVEQLNIALSILRVRNRPGTKGRQTAIEREMRRRTQAGRTPGRAAQRAPHEPFATLSLQTGKRTRMLYCSYDRSGGPISLGRSRTRCPRCGAELKKAVASVS
jgi:hypothetical protein